MPACLPSRFAPNLRRAPSAALARADAGGAVDLSVPQIGMSKSPYGASIMPEISELLYAIPWLRAAPPVGSLASGPDLFVQVQRPSAMATPSVTASVFDGSTATMNDLSQTAAAVESYRLVRMGGLVNVPKIDADVTRATTAHNAASFQIETAAYQLLRDLDISIARGDGTGSPAQSVGLAKLVSNNSTKFTATSLSSDLRRLLASAFTNGGGAGEGIHALFGGPLVMRKLMSLSEGQNGASGWRMDPRTGLFVYHFMGVPYFRTNTDESTASSCSMYGANLGPMGLNMVYTSGSSDSFGIECEETAFTANPGRRVYYLEGAWALVTWHDGALWGLDSIDCTSV